MMWTIVWKSLLLAAAGTVLLRLGGRKSIAQMTTPQLAVLLTVGAILGSEVAGKGIVASLLAVGTFIVFLLITEWVTLRWNSAETILKGKAVPVISNGEMILDNMKSLRLTVDDLEKRLRMEGIPRIEDVKTGTIEDNGELGYELMPHAKPVTMGELERLLKANIPQFAIPNPPKQANLFTEVEHDSHNKDIPTQLQ
jgi:uncharacterized membrane protein YcaP (DUF421 family)